MTTRTCCSAALIIFVLILGCSQLTVEPTTVVPPSMPTLLSPANGAIEQSLSPTLTWSTVSNAETYHVQVATDSLFTSLFVKDSIVISSLTLIHLSLASSTKYYWRINAVNTCGSSGWSSIWSFSTPAWWNALGTGLNGCVTALTIDGSGNLYVGGNFTTAGGVAAHNIAKWDGSSWSTFGNGLNNQVTAFAFDGSGNLYVGGWFDSAGGVPANNIAKWNGSTWSALGTGMGGNAVNTVFALAFDGSGNLYAGGSFLIAGGVIANGIAKWDGSTWSALGSP